MLLTPGPIQTSLSRTKLRRHLPRDHLPQPVDASPSVNHSRKGASHLKTRLEL
jgi:hypothetical protein